MKLHPDSKGKRLGSKAKGKTVAEALARSAGENVAIARFKGKRVRRVKL